MGSWFLLVPGTLLLRTSYRLSGTSYPTVPYIIESKYIGTYSVKADVISRMLAEAYVSLYHHGINNAQSTCNVATMQYSSLVKW